MFVPRLGLRSVPYCTNCGEEYREAQRFCGNCGQTVGKAPSASLPPEPDRPSVPSQEAQRPNSGPRAQPSEAEQRPSAAPLLAVLIPVFALMGLALIVGPQRFVFSLGSAMPQLILLGLMLAVAVLVLWTAGKVMGRGR